jgi:hypothetical protein
LSRSRLRTKAPNLTSVYSFRLAVDFGAAARLSRSARPQPQSRPRFRSAAAMSYFFPDRFAPLLKPVRPDLKITTVPSIGMTVTPEGIAAVRNLS